MPAEVVIGVGEVPLDAPPIAFVPYQSNAFVLNAVAESAVAEAFLQYPTGSVTDGAGGKSLIVTVIVVLGLSQLDGAGLF